jgi:hypothetical protein
MTHPILPRPEATGKDKSSEVSRKLFSYKITPLNLWRIVCKHYFDNEHDLIALDDPRVIPRPLVQKNSLNSERSPIFVGCWFENWPALKSSRRAYLIFS